MDPPPNGSTLDLRNSGNPQTTTGQSWGESRKPPPSHPIAAPPPPHPTPPRPTPPSPRFFPEPLDPAAGDSEEVVERKPSLASKPREELKAPLGKSDAPKKPETRDLECLGRLSPFWFGSLLRKADLLAKGLVSLSWAIVSEGSKSFAFYLVWTTSSTAQVLPNWRHVTSG